MKVLILADFYSSQSIGGAGIVIFDEVQALRAAGREVSVVTVTNKREEAGESYEHGVKVYRLYSDYASRWRAYMSLYNYQVVSDVKNIVHKELPDIVHIQSIHTYLSYYCLKLAKKAGARVFITMHDVMAIHYSKFTEFINTKDPSVPATFDYHIGFWQLARIYTLQFNPFRNVIIRHYLKYADKIFAVSHALKQALNDNGIDNVEVLYNGIDPHSWVSTRDEVSRFRTAYHLDGKKVVQFSGWTTGAKGGDQILFAMKKVVEKIPNAVLVAVGRTDIYYESMKKNAAQTGMQDHIIYPGFLRGNDLVSSYECADIVAFPSVCLDTFGMVNLEGMLSKKPVIATCFGGAPEIVIDGVTGYIINPYDIDTFADRIIELINDPKKAERFGQAGYERALKFFNKKDKIAELLAWYG